MRGDFSRDTYQRANGYSRVVFQQGRDLVEADFNEQAAIQGHQVRALADVSIGWPGKQSTDPPFKVRAALSASGKTLDVTLQGWYFTRGVRFDFGPPDKPTTWHLPALAEQDKRPVVLYLDVYEQTIHPAMRPDLLEPALDPRDTTLRRRPVASVQGLPVDAAPESPKTEAAFRTLLGPRARPGAGKLSAKIDLTLGGAADRCAPQADDTYQGLENQLYRVEIHAPAVQGTSDARFKWSRDNASISYTVDSYFPTGTQSLKVALKQTPPDDTWALNPGDWVELVGAALPPVAGLGDDPFGSPVPLLQVEDVDAAANSVTLTLPADPLWKDFWGALTAADYPLLVRWDQHVPPPGTLEISKEWQPLESGINVSFQGTDFRPGDYWLIPARALTGVLLGWGDKDNPLVKEPWGEEHSYVPLAIFYKDRPADKAVDLYPWGAAVTPTPEPGADFPSRLVVNAPGTTDPPSPIQPKDATGHDLAVRLAKASLEAVVTYTLPQMLVIAMTDVTQTLPDWDVILEQLRRFHRQHKTTLAELIRTKVDAILVAGTVPTILAGGSKPPDVVRITVNVFKDIQGVTPDAATIDKLNAMSPALNTIPAIVTNTKDETDFVTKVTGKQPLLPAPGTDKQVDLLIALWRAAVRLYHYFEAWPYRKIDKAADWS